MSGGEWDSVRGRLPENYEQTLGNSLEDMCKGNFVVIQQTPELGEILLGFETKNRYQIMGEQGMHIGYAAEEGGGVGAFLLRQLFGPMRKARLHLYSRAGQPIATARKPFRWFFYEMELYEQGRFLGRIKKRWAWVRKRLTVYDHANQPVFTIIRPFWHWWTFKVHLGAGIKDPVVGRIMKRWSGLLKEMFSDADNFVVEFSNHPSMTMDLRKVLFLAAFLIDFSFFDSSGGGSSGGMGVSFG